MNAKEKLAASVGCSLLASAVAVGVFVSGPGAVAGAIGLGFFGIIFLMSALE